MSYDEEIEVKKTNKVLRWFQDWISDWFGLLDIIVGILTFTLYYPNTQQWWFKLWKR